jgi:hypothetical protein
LKTKLKLIILTLAFSQWMCGQNDSLQISDLHIDSLGDLRWTITSYRSVIGRVERWNGSTWTPVANFNRRRYSVIPLKGAPTTEKKPRVLRKEIDNVKVRVKFHQGLNRYRVVLVKPQSLISPEIELTSRVSNDDGSLWIVGDAIILDQKEYYEIMDQDAKTILKGENEKINITSLPKGSYYLYTKKATRAFTK